MEEKIGVLVIDDEPTVADALKLILDDNGYKAVVARNGREVPIAGTASPILNDDGRLIGAVLVVVVALAYLIGIRL